MSGKKPKQVVACAYFFRHETLGFYCKTNRCEGTRKNLIHVERSQKSSFFIKFCPHPYSSTKDCILPKSGGYAVGVFSKDSGEIVIKFGSVKYPMFPHYDDVEWREQACYGCDLEKIDPVNIDPVKASQNCQRFGCVVPCNEMDVKDDFVLSKDNMMILVLTNNSSLVHR